MIATGVAHAPARLLERKNIPSGELVHLAKLALKQQNATQLITGLAPGWEQALAMAAVELEIPFTVAVPYPGRDLAWGKEERRLYYSLLAKARKVHRVSDTYHQGVTLEAHQWQVARADALLALWDYDFQGETYETMGCALESGKAVVNLWEDWRHLRDLRKLRRVTTLPAASQPEPHGARVYEKKVPAEKQAQAEKKAQA